MQPALAPTVTTSCGCWIFGLEGQRGEVKEGTLETRRQRKNLKAFLTLFKIISLNKQVCALKCINTKLQKVCRNTHIFL